MRALRMGLLLLLVGCDTELIVLGPAEIPDASTQVDASSSPDAGVPPDAPDPE